MSFTEENKIIDFYAVHKICWAFVFQLTYIMHAYVWVLLLQSYYTLFHWSSNYNYIIHLFFFKVFGISGFWKWYSRHLISLCYHSSTDYSLNTFILKICFKCCNTGLFNKHENYTYCIVLCSMKNCCKDYFKILKMVKIWPHLLLIYNKPLI